MKLTNDMRRKLSKTLIDKRFKNPAIDIAKRYRLFAYDVYTACFDQTDLRRIRRMPHGWLEEVSSFKVVFKADVVQIEGDPFQSLGDHLSHQYGDSLDLEIEFRMPHHLVGSRYNSKPIRVFGTDCELYDTWQGIHSDIIHYSDKIREARRSIEATLNSCSTTKKLVLAWPEVEPFVASLTPAKCVALAVPSSKLNRMLGLP